MCVTLYTIVHPSSSSSYMQHSTYNQLHDDGVWADEEEMMMESETSRRMLAQTSRHISYGALDRNRIPCNRRGRSYYDCYSHQRANPYTRGCSKITHCARNNH
ncbi:hypothetical protein ACS0TY_031841 [Phlomoides rotata]